MSHRGSSFSFECSPQITLSLRSLHLILALVLPGVGCSGTGDAVGGENPEAAPVAEVTQQTGTIPSGRFEPPYIMEGTGIPTIVVGSAKYYQRAFSQELWQHLH